MNAGRENGGHVYGAAKGDVVEKLARLQANAFAGILSDPQRLMVATRWVAMRQPNSTRSSKRSL
jgi:hypothetical protein